MITKKSMKLIQKIRELGRDYIKIEQFRNGGWSFYTDTEVSDTDCDAHEYCSSDLNEAIKNVYDLVVLDVEAENNHT